MRHHRIYSNIRRTAREHYGYVQVVRVEARAAKRSPPRRDAMEANV